MEEGTTSKSAEETFGVELGSWSCRENSSAVGVLSDIAAEDSEDDSVETVSCKGSVVSGARDDLAIGRESE